MQLILIVIVIAALFRAELFVFLAYGMDKFFPAVATIGIVSDCWSYTSLVIGSRPDRATIGYSGISLFRDFAVRHTLVPVGDDEVFRGNTH